MENDKSDVWNHIKNTYLYIIHIKKTVVLVIILQLKLTKNKKTLMHQNYLHEMHLNTHVNQRIMHFHHI